MQKRNIIVIGASAGGFQAIQQLIAGLPPDLDVSIFIVWHLSPDVQGILPHALNRLKNMYAANAIDREPIKTRRIYVAPPDHHMMLEDGIVRISRGPKENRFRPAIDPLFRTAATVYGPRVIGVILSGGLDDGTAGLWMIKQMGGMAVVQDPDDAEVPSMPASALREVAVDYRLPLSGIPQVLASLAIEVVNPQPQDVSLRISFENDIAKDNRPLNSHIMEFGELSPYTCPECHGVLTAIREDNRTRFRCHTGHAFSADSLLVGITQNIEDALWNAVRQVRESVMLLYHMGDHFAEDNKPALAAAYFKKAQEAEQRAELLLSAVQQHEPLSSDGIEQESGHTS